MQLPTPIVIVSPILGALQRWSFGPWPVRAPVSRLPRNYDTGAKVTMARSAYLFLLHKIESDEFICHKLASVAQTQDSFDN